MKFGGSSRSSVSERHVKIPKLTDGKAKKRISTDLKRGLYMPFGRGQRLCNTINPLRSYNRA